MKSAVLLSLGALALATPTPIPNKVPFSRRNAYVPHTDGSVDAQRLFNHLRYTLKKYNKDYELPEYLKNVQPLEKRAGTTPLTDQVEAGVDELYYGTGIIGAAKQAFTFDFDTGSSDVFVPGPKCGKSQGCSGNTKYNQKGKDEGNTTTVTYGSGMITGENYFDSLTVGGYTATGQNIISLTSASGFSTSDAEGLLGLAFPAIANSEQPPFFFTLMNEKKINPTEFSFYLGRSASGTGNKSELTFGGVDSSKYTGAFTKVPVTSQTYWQVDVAGATVGGKSVGGTSAQAAVDTGTTVVIAPTTAALAIYNAIPGAFLLPLEGGATEQVFAYPCASKPQVAFTLGGKNFVINNKDFSLGTVSGLTGIAPLDAILKTLLGQASTQYCIGSIIGANLDPTTPLYILGDSFLKNWYATFQYVSPSSASVNLAKSV